MVLVYVALGVFDIAPLPSLVLDYCSQKVELKALKRENF